MMSRQFGIVMLTAFVCGALPVHADLLEWRTEVQVTNGSGNATAFAFDGGLNDPSSFQSLSTSSGSALAEASSSLSADGFTPTLRVYAKADPTRAQAVAWAVQGYTNTLATPLSTSLLLNLTADITGSNELNAHMYLFQAKDFEFYGDNGTMLFESSSQLWPGFEPFTNNLGPAGFDVSIRGQNGPVNETRSFDFTVNPGESFYVWSSLIATADSRGVVDAFSTMTSSFTNTEGLRPAAVDAPPVPEPASIALLGLGIIGLAARRGMGN